jgi:hypothetical protein
VGYTQGIPPIKTNCCNLLHFCETKQFFQKPGSHYLILHYQTKKSKLFRGVIVVDFENHTKHINVLCGKNARFLDIKVHNSEN